jgi:hypothetical protein
VELEEMLNSLKSLVMQFMDSLFLIWASGSSVPSTSSPVSGKLRTLGLRIRAKHRLVESKLRAQSGGTNTVTVSHGNTRSHVPSRTSASYQAPSNDEVNEHEPEFLYSSQGPPVQMSYSSSNARNIPSTGDFRNDFECYDDEPSASKYTDKSHEVACSSSKFHPKTNFASKLSNINEPSIMVTSSPEISASSTPVTRPKPVITNKYIGGGDSFMESDNISWPSSPPRNNYDAEDNFTYPGRNAAVKEPVRGEYIFHIWCELN